MKKFITFMLLMCLLVTGLTACGGAAEKVSNSGNDTQTEDHSNDVLKNGYAFKTKDGTEIVIDAEFDQFKSALGSEKSCFESPSCAFGDLDKIWSYNGFDVYTYQVDKTDYVSSVILKDDTVGTAEKIYIGDSEEDVISAYGDPSVKDAAQIVYRKDEMSLTFILSNGTVTQIQYSTNKA
ncbi:MAG: hypothetical protein IKD87_08870 [Oscillospiraceae bacterium]|nr:hypothetical protein [Oscillospiraceae bacterium]